MSIPLKKEKDLLSNKNISASNILTKRENLSNDKKRNIIDNRFNKRNTNKYK